MYNQYSFFSTITNPHSVVTAIPSSRTYPEFLKHRIDTYSPVIAIFSTLVQVSESSFDLLERIRTPKSFDPSVRMSLLKIFRRCVCTVLDTEATKKITKNNT